jgi:D-glycero-alpha-D-manno-heptose-7-phosphate kinase
MIISRTPFRVSFFGGGTDYPDWFSQHQGATLATTINKYCYITCRFLPPFFDHRSRIVYSEIERVKKVQDIRHPAVREVLKFLKMEEGVEIHHDGDLPARTGLGSSSSFTVGLLNALYALQGIMPTKERLAKEAICIEQERCQENVGCQDQVLAAHGGFNYIEFGGPDHLRVTKVTLPSTQIKRLENHLMIFFTGFSRMSSEIAAHQIKNIPQKKQELLEIYQMSKMALELLNKDDLLSFGRLLDQAWQIKKGLSDRVSTPYIDQIYQAARESGAMGGKLLGAGGGGFVLLFATPEHQPRIREKLKNLLEVPFHFEMQGSQIIFYQPNI